MGQLLPDQVVSEQELPQLPLAPPHCSQALSTPAAAGQAREAEALSAPAAGCSRQGQRVGTAADSVHWQPLASLGRLLAAQAHLGDASKQTSLKYVCIKYDTPNDDSAGSRR